MTIEEAIRHFEVWAACNYKQTREAAKLAIEALRSKKEAENTGRSEWISVENRLPQNMENVLAANKRGKIYDIDKAWWNGASWCRCAKGTYRNVTHWMPLPPPPQMEVIAMKTNADRIREMTDRELADFLCGFQNREDCAACIAGHLCEYGERGIDKWLRQPIEEET